MKTRHLLTILLLAACNLSAMAQIHSDKDYQALKIGGGGKSKTEGGELITVTVLPLGDDRLFFRDRKDNKPIDGTYRLVVDKNRFHIAEISKGLAHGTWEEYYHDKLFKKATYQKGYCHGKLIEYPSVVYSSDVDYSEYTMREGVPQSYISYYKNGQVEEERSYNEKGRLDGPAKKYNAAGDLVGDATYVNGKAQGKKMETNREGYVSHWELQDGKPCGKYSKLYPNGNIMEQGTFYDTHRKTGQWLHYTEDGELTLEENYQENKLHGVKRVYFSGNRLKSEEGYDDGKLHGNVVYYDPDPYTKTKEGAYRNGNLHGVFKVYHDGILWRETIYQDGKEIGKKEYAGGKLQIVKLIDETGAMTDVEKYDNTGKKVYRNQTYKKHNSLKLKEDAHGVIDVEF